MTLVGILEDLRRFCYDCPKARHLWGMISFDKFVTTVFYNYKELTAWLLDD